MLNLPSVTNSLALLLASVRSELLMAGVPLQSFPTDTGAILGKHDVLRGCGTAAGARCGTAVSARSCRALRPRRHSSSPRQHRRRKLLPQRPKMLSRRRRRCPLGGGPCADMNQPRLRSAPFGGDGEASADTAALASQLSEDAEDHETPDEDDEGDCF